MPDNDHLLVWTLDDGDGLRVVTRHPAMTRPVVWEKERAVWVPVGALNLLPDGSPDGSAVVELTREETVRARDFLKDAARQAGTTAGAFLDGIVAAE
jgi:hypothetical protein